MSYILAIDPGNTNSAVAILDKEYYCSVKHDILDNHELLSQIRFGYSGPNSLLPFYCPDTIVIERITGYNMGVGQTVFDTLCLDRSLYRGGANGGLQHISPSADSCFASPPRN